MGKTGFLKKLTFGMVAALLVAVMLPAPVLAVPPLAPSGLTANLTGPTQNQVTLNWTDGSPDETGFVIERSINLFASLERDFTVLANTTLFVDTTVSPGITYNYRVKAVNIDGSSLPSNVATVAVPSQAPVITMVNPTPPGTIQSGAPNVIQASVSSNGSALTSVEWQVVNNVGIAPFDALEIFGQVAPAVPFAGAANDNTAVAGSAEVTAALPNARILFVIFGNVNNINTLAGGNIVMSVGANPAMNVNIPAGTDLRGAVVGNTVRLVGERALAGGTPVMIEAVAVRPAADNSLTVENAFLFNGTVTAIGVSPGGETQWTVTDSTTVPATVGVFNVGAAAIDPGFGLAPDNPVITVEFGLAAVPAGLPTPPVLSALEIFAQVPLDAQPRHPNPVADTTPASIEVPAGSGRLFVIFGVVTAVNRTTGEWQIGNPPVFVYESADTVVRDFPLRGGVDDAPAVGDGIGRLVANRSLGDGPIVAEVIVGDDTAGQTAGPVSMETAYLFNGTVTAATATTWTVTPAVGGAPATFDITGSATDAGLGLAPVNNPVVTVEFGVSGGAPLTRNDAWTPLVLNTAENLFQGTVNLPAVPAPTAQGAWIYIRATNAAGQTTTQLFPNTLAVVAAAAPTAPSGLTANLAGVGGVGLSWVDNSNNEASFRIDRTTSANFTSPFTSVIAPANRTTFSDSTVVRGTTYRYRVVALNGAAGEPASNTAAILVDVPQAPSGVSGTVVAANQVTLTWTDTSTTETGFKILRRTGANPFVQIGTVGPNVTVFSDTSTTPQTIFDYQVIAVNGIGDSLPGQGQVVVGAFPAAPSGLIATLVDRDAVTAGVQPGVRLNWIDNATNETGYHLHRVDTATSAATHFILAANSVTFTDNATLNQTLRYAIHGINELGDGPDSNTVTVTVAAPTAPTGFAAAAISATQIDLSWTDLNNEESYTVTRAIDGGAFLALATPAKNVVTLSDSNNVTQGHTFAYQITATNIQGTSAASSAQASTNPPAAPVLNTTTAQANGLVAVNWTDNSSGETGFRVKRATDNVTFGVIATLNPNTVTYADVAAAPQTVYQYQVEAFNGLGTGISNTLQVTSATPTAPPNAPSGLTATAASFSQVNLSWTDNSFNESGFRVERAVDTASFTVLPSGSSLALNSITFTDIAAPASSNIQYRVVAFNTSGNSTAAGPVSVTTPAAPAPSGGGGGGGGGATTVTTTTISLSGLSGSLAVDTTGAVQAAATISTADGKVSVAIPANTTMRTSTGAAISSLSVAAASPPAQPPQAAVVVNYNFGPDGAVFNPPLSITIGYTDAQLPAGASEADLYAAWWDGSQWVKLETTVNAATNTLVARVAHFTNVAVIAPSPAPAPTSAPAPALAPTSAPTLTITSPSEGATLSAGNINVTVQVSNLELVPIGQPNAEGQGHIHYYLDVDIPTTPGAPAVTAAGTYKPGAGTTVTWENVGPGTHTFGAQLVNNNHTPLEPAVTAKVTVTMTAPATTAPTTPAPAPSTPTPGAAPGMNWWWIVIAAVIIVVIVGVILMRRRSA